MSFHEPIPETMETIAAIASVASSCTTLGELRAVLERVPASILALSDRMVFKASSYSRLVLVEDKAVSVRLLGWLPGQVSEIHDHGGSMCALRVLQGIATESGFELDGCGNAVLLGTESYLTGSVLGCDGNAIHAMGNDAAAIDPLVTLHVYRPAPVMRAYQLADEVHA